MPAITLTPSSANPGATITVKGTGFSKRQKVKMRIDPPNGTVKSYTCSTTGTFTGTVITGAASSIGLHAVTVTPSTGTTILAKGTFTLVAVQPPPTGPKVTAGPTLSNITQTSVTVTWTLSENCTGQIQYGQSTAYGQLSLAETSFNYATHIQTLNNLLPDTTYHLRVLGKNAAGLTYASSDVSFKTLATVVTLPSAPINLSAIAGDTRVTVNWGQG